jgi:hypothetical protein
MVPPSLVSGLRLRMTQAMPGSRMRIRTMRDSTGRIGTMVTPPSNHLMLTYTHILEAYYHARRSERSSPSVLEWEYDYESRCYDLFELLHSGDFQWDVRRAFVVQYPVWREIIVPTFRDRVVHHLIARHIEPIAERLYIYDIYAGRSCR